MKNNLQRILISVFFLLQYSVAFSQTSLDFINIGPITYNAPYLYVADNNNAFSIRKKSDFKFSYNYAIKSTVTPANDYSNFYYYYEDPVWTSTISSFNIGYSPLPHLYTTANLLLTNISDNYSAAPNSKVVLGDIGIGGYYLKELKNIFKKKNIFNRTSKWMMPQKGILVNALLGYSRGSITHELVDWRSGHGKFTLNKFYGQVGFDYQARLWGFASSLKVGVLNYGTTYLEGHAVTELYRPVEVLAEKNNYNFSELNFRFYVGMKYGQIYLNGVKTKVDTELEDFMVSDYLSVGAVLHIQEFFKKKNKDEK